MKQIAYEQIKNELKTGDLILFSGQYKMSHTVEELENSKWSHVAMVIRLPEYEEPLLYEATALTNLPDLLSQDKITGPKVVKLIDRLKTYGQDVVPYVAPIYGVRRLNHALPLDSIGLLKELLVKCHGIPNPDTWQMIWEVVVGRYLHIKTPMTHLTCSAFIAYTYEELGLLTTNKPINGFMPKDFSTDGQLKLNAGYQLSQEIILKL